MTDRELIELAAKAAGIPAQYSENWGDFSIGEPYSKGEKRWNPLTDDGDALRLAVKLHIQHGQSLNSVWAQHHNSDGIPVERIAEHPDIYSATRRAIVRAAAELGKSKTD